MGNETNSTTEQALTNLAAIQNGDDPRSQAHTRVSQVQDEVMRLCMAHDLPEGLDRSHISCFVADWQRKIGTCKYNQRVDPDEYGQRVTNIERESGAFSIGIAKRAFDSDDTWLDTVAHELAHVTAYIRNGYKSANHGPLWTQEACRFGADPTRTDRVAPENRVDANYFLGCPDGCFQNGKQRRGKRVQQPGRYRCPECNTRCVSWEQGHSRPLDPGVCAVDISDL